MLSLFRIIVQCSALEPAVHFYTRLLGDPGRRVHETRHYFDCGPVILAVVDEGSQARPNPDFIYLGTSDLEGVHARCAELGCLDPGDIHGFQKAGAIEVRPWGERSFYVRDPLGTGLCFVDDTTLFRGN